MTKKLVKDESSIWSGLDRRLVVNRAVREDCFKVEPANHRWIKVNWTLTEATLERAIASMGPEWHRCEPVLKLSRVKADESGPHARQLHEHVAIPVDSHEWFLNVPSGEKFWQVELGYLSKTGKFFSLMHSSAINMPGNPADVRNSSNSEDYTVSIPFDEQIDEIGLNVKAELVLTGTAHPAAIVTVDDVEMVIDNRTGRFQWRTTLCNGRFVVPIEAVTDRERQRILLAVEANTHHLDNEHLPRK